MPNYAPPPAGNGRGHPMAPDGRAPDGRRSQWVGLLLMVAATTALGLFPSGARIAYAGGSTPETVAVLRHVLTVLLVGILLSAKGRPSALLLQRGMLGAALGLGAILAVYSWAYIAAIRYIPVSLAVLLLYTFPAQVVLMLTLFGGERATPVRLLCIGMAFSGVALAVGIDSAGLDWRGLGLGLLAGFGLALITVLLSRATSGTDGRPLTLHLALVATVLTGVFVGMGPGFALPQTPLAWGGFLFAGGAAALGITLYFLALPLIGPVRTSVLSNLEPVVAIAGAVAFLGERPSGGQLVGVVLVLSAIVLQQFADRRVA